MPCSQADGSRTKDLMEEFAVVRQSADNRLPRSNSCHDPGHLSLASFPLHEFHFKGEE